MKERNFKVSKYAGRYVSVGAIYDLNNGTTLCVSVHKERGIGHPLCAYVDVKTSDHRSEYHLNDWHGGDDRRWSVRYVVDSSEVGITSGRREVTRAISKEVGINKIRTILRRLVARAGWTTYVGYSTTKKRVIDPITDRVGMDWGKPIIGLI